MDKRFKGLVVISDVLDDRYQKLSDKYHELELSHNRKKKVLSRLLSVFREEKRKSLGLPYIWIEHVDFIIRQCESALFCDGRCNCRPIVKCKMKGGKDAINAYGITYVYASFPPFILHLTIGRQLQRPSQKRADSH